MIVPWVTLSVLNSTREEMMSNKAVVAVVATAALVGGLYLINKRYGDKIREILKTIPDVDTSKAEVKEPLRLTHEKEAE